MIKNDSYFELQKKIDELASNGYRDIVNRAVRVAQIATRSWIERQHPKTAFGGKSLSYDNFNGKTHNQIIKGSFKIHAGSVDANLYANYFSRWYNTGATQHVIMRGKYHGRKSTEYPARKKIMAGLNGAVEQYFGGVVEKYIKKRLKL